MTDGQRAVRLVPCDLHAQYEPRLPQVLHLECGFQPLLETLQQSDGGGEDEEIVDVQADDDRLSITAVEVDTTVLIEWDESEPT